MTNMYAFDLNENPNNVITKILAQKDNLSLKDIVLAEDDSSCNLILTHSYDAVYGLGERFNQVNQKGSIVRSEVIEKFCNQGDISYCPIPFFFTDNRMGVFVDTFTVTEYNFGEKIEIKINKDSNGRLPVIYFFCGNPAEIIMSFSEISGKPKMIPKWSLGPWMSANRWNTEEEIKRQLDFMKTYKLPHSVMVIEAWSDEATFYRFNEHGEWKDPQRLVKLLLDNDIRLLLWQIPVIKKMDNNEKHEILELDWDYAIKNRLCIFNVDGTPYTIPEDHWFAGSLLLDFTKQEAVNWWFEKRKYLLDMGVAGFKTDGGEFILRDDIIASNGCTGLEMRNGYAASYVEAYCHFAGKDRVLFSRAGYKGQQRYPIQWAGDQMSTWEEFRHILAAGLSIGLSGIPFWSFDIGGFAGPMPSLNLYERATQMAIFTPIMQWHSEPVGGQYSDILSTKQGVNDRSPWNISILYEDESAIERLRFHYNMRMNLLPYLYKLSLDSSETGIPLMKHLILEYPEDKKVHNIDDCFMLGDMLVAPILEEDKMERVVYLPQGNWIPLWQVDSELLDQRGSSLSEKLVATQKEEASHPLNGGCRYRITSGLDRIPVFIREGGCIAVNLDNTLELGSDVSSNTNSYKNLCFYITGSAGEYHFKDNLNNELLIKWDNTSYKIDWISGNIDIKVIKR